MSRIKKKYKKICISNEGKLESHIPTAHENRQINQPILFKKSYLIVDFWVEGPVPRVPGALPHRGARAQARGALAHSLSVDLDKYSVLFIKYSRTSHANKGDEPLHTVLALI